MFILYVGLLRVAACTCIVLLYYMFCAVGRRLPCRMHVSLHRRSDEIVWSMYMYSTGRYRVCVIKGTTIKFCMSGSQKYLVLPTVGYPTCSDKWRPDKWHLTVVRYSVLFMSAYQMCYLWLKLPRPCMPVLWLFLAPIYYSAHWNHLAHQ